MTGTPRQRNFILVLGAIGTASFLLRLVVCAELSAIRSVTHPWSGTDMATYRKLALDICAGHLPASFYYQPFYYTVFLPTVYTLLGKGAWGVMTAQALLGGATVWLTGLAGAKLFGRRAGLAAALLLCFSRFHAFYTPFLLIAVLQSFWLSLLVYATICCWEKPTHLRWLLLALVTSAAVLTRGNVLLLVPVLISLLVWRRRRKLRDGIAMAVCFVALVYLPQLPFALRNHTYHSRWTGPSSAQDAVLALGNTPEAPPGGLEYPATYHQWLSDASDAGEQRVPVSRQILRWAALEPVLFLDLKIRAFLLFWHRLEIPNNVSMSNEGRHSILLRLPFMLEFSILGVCGLFGMVCSWHNRSPKRLFLYAVVGIYCLSTVLFYVLTRFRVPFLPALCIFGGAGISRLYRDIRRYSKHPEAGRRRLLVAALAAVAAVFVVHAAFPRYQQCIEKPLMRHFRPRGVLVNTARKALVYDHGPLAVGGFTALPLPPEGVTVEKVFAIWPQFLCPGEEGQALLKIPLVIAEGAHFDFRLEGVEQASDTEAAFERDAGLTWFVVPLSAASMTRGPVLCRAAIGPIRGSVLLGIDILRDYDRTRVFDSRGNLLSVPGEAAFELEWRKSKVTESVDADDG